MYEHLSLYDLLFLKKADPTDPERKALSGHLENCGYCRERFTAVTSPQMPKIRRHRPKEDNDSFNYCYCIYLPAFDPEAHTRPEAIHPVLAVSDAFGDEITGVNIIKTVVLHDRPEMAGEGDIFLEEDDDRFVGWVAGMWSLQEVPASVLDKGTCLGMLGTDTSLHVKRYLTDDEPGSLERLCHTPLHGNSDPRVQMRRRFLIDYSTLTDDIDGRRAWKLRVLDQFADNLPQLSPREKGAASLSEIISALFDQFYNETDQMVEITEEAFALTASAAAADPHRFRRYVEARCGNIPEGPLLRIIKTLLPSELYIQTGNPEYLKEARELLENG